MAQYKYKMINKDGEEKKGVFSASSRNEVVAMIRNNGCIPVEVKEKKQKEFNHSFGNGVKTKDLALFCRQMYTILKAGAPLLKSMDIIVENMKNQKLKKAVESLSDSIQKGISLSEGMKLHRDVFPDMLINMMSAGEISGSIDVIFERMAEHYEKENKLINSFKTAMTYPFILLFVSGGVVTFLLTVVMPKFMKIYTSSKVELPKVTKMLMYLSDLLKNQFIAIIGVFILVVIGYRFLNSKKTTRLFFDRIKLKTPIIGNVRKKIGAARFTRTVSSMLKSGIPIVVTVEAVAGVMGNRYFESVINGAKEKIIKGESFSKAVSEIEEFPNMISSMAKIGEESGELEEILNKTADFFDQEVEETLKKMITLMEPLLIMIMALVIGFIVLAIMMPMFDMANAM